MKSQCRFLSVFIPVVLLLFTFAGCDDSKNPLSDPQTSSRNPDWPVSGWSGRTTVKRIGTSVVQARSFRTA